MFIVSSINRHHIFSDTRLFLTPIVGTAHQLQPSPVCTIPKYLTNSSHSNELLNATFSNSHQLQPNQISCESEWEINFHDNMVSSIFNSWPTIQHQQPFPIPYCSGRSTTAVVKSNSSQDHTQWRSPSSLFQEFSCYRIYPNPNQSLVMVHDWASKLFLWRPSHPTGYTQIKS